MSQRNLHVTKIDQVVSMKPEYRNDPTKEWELRAMTQRHLQYLHDSKLLDVNNKEHWGRQDDANGKPVFVHFYQRHALKISHGGPQENPVLVVTSTDGLGNNCSMNISAAGAGISLTAITVAGLAIVLQMGFAAMAAEDALAAAGAAAGSALGEAAIEITCAEVLGPIGIALAVLSFIIVLAMFLGERDIALNLRYENRSSKKSVKLVGCWTWNLIDLPTEPPAEMQPVGTVDGFDVYDVVSYQHDNTRKSEGVGLSLLFQSGAEYANVCIRNDIHKWPTLGIQPGKRDPKDFYYDLPQTQINTPTAWGSLVIRNTFKVEEFNNYQFHGIISFHDADQA